MSRTSVTEKKSGKAGKQQAASRNGRQTLHSTRIDLDAKVRLDVIELLNQTLADCLDLKSQVKQAHWNVKGPQFYQLHLLFDEMASEVEEQMDSFAERITTLAGTAFGTVRRSAANSQLPELDSELVDGLDFVATLADRYAAFGRQLRENIDECADLGDVDSSDLYTEVSRDVDKRLWFLEAHLQG